jgi:hypothetical protein
MRLWARYRKSVATAESDRRYLLEFRPNTVLPKIIFKPELREDGTDMFQLLVESPPRHAESLAYFHHRKILLEEQPAEFPLAWR